MFDRFYGNRRAAATLRQMLAGGRIPQTILLDGPRGVGKATLVRRFAAELLGDAAKIEADDLALEANRERIAEREKWTAEKRNEEPLLFATHPDFLTFAPDGPLRQLSISQMRALRELAPYRPLRGERRVFLIDEIDRANEQAANSLLKTLEEPPEHLIVFLTTSNAYDLLPTIRSRAVPVRLAPLREAEMEAFLAGREGVEEPKLRLALAGGSPGLAVSIDLDAYKSRREAMLALLKTASGAAPFSAWVKYSEKISASKSEKLEEHLAVLGQLLEDLLLVSNGLPAPRAADVARDMAQIQRGVGFPWILRAVTRVSELARQVRRNIQKSLALDSLAVELRSLTT
jgi:DNA polymerase-3 subunit delta'